MNSDRELLQQALAKLHSAMCCHPNAVQPLIGEAENYLARALTAPQPAAQPVQDSVAKDAARYRWLASRFTGYDFYFGGDPMAETAAGKGCVIAAFEVGQDFRGSEDITKSIDAAIEAAHGIRGNK